MNFLAGPSNSQLCRYMRFVPCIQDFFLVCSFFFFSLATPWPSALDHVRSSWGLFFLLFHLSYRCTYMRPIQWPRRTPKLILMGNIYDPGQTVTVLSCSIPPSRCPEAREQESRRERKSVRVRSDLLINGKIWKYHDLWETCVRCSLSKFRTIGICKRDP